MNKLLTIGEVAQLFDIASSQIRFYERKDLIKPTLIGDNGYRYYDFKAIDKISVIILLRALELPVAEIKEIIGKDKREIQRCIYESRAKVVSEIDRLNKLLTKVDYMTEELGDFEEGQIRTLDIEARLMYVLSETNVFAMSERDVFEFFVSHDLPFINIKHDLYYIHTNENLHLYGLHDRDNTVIFKDAPTYYLKAGSYLEWCLEIEDFDKVADIFEALEKKAKKLGYRLTGDKIVINELSSILYSKEGIPVKIQVGIGET